MGMGFLLVRIYELWAVINFVERVGMVYAIFLVNEIYKSFSDTILEYLRKMGDGLVLELIHVIQEDALYL